MPCLPPLLLLLPTCCKRHLREAGLLVTHLCWHLSRPRIRMWHITQYATHSQLPRCPLRILELLVLLLLMAHQVRRLHSIMLLPRELPQRQQVDVGIIPKQVDHIQVAIARGCGRRGCGWVSPPSQCRAHGRLGSS